MLKILVVDDSLIMRRNVTKIVESLGYKVVADAKDGQEAIEAYRRCKPDLVTMDITMPEMDGIEAVKGIKKIDREAKIMMVTSHGQEDMVISAIRAGASGYLLKPINITKVHDAIRKVFPSIVDETASEQKEGESLEDDELIFPEIEDV